MKNVLIIGKPGAGKSVQAENVLRKFAQDETGTRKNCMFDINKEHKSIKNSLDFVYPYGCGLHEFLNHVTEKDEKNDDKIKHTNILFEEATFFMSTSGNLSGRVLDLMCRTFHTKNLNVFNFHFLRKVPTDIMGFADFIFIFQSEDRLEDIKTRFKDFPRVISAYKTIRLLTDGTNMDRNTKTYLPGSYKIEPGDEIYPRDQWGTEIKRTAEYSKQHFHDKFCIAK